MYIHTNIHDVEWYASFVSVVIPSRAKEEEDGRASLSIPGDVPGFRYHTKAQRHSVSEVRSQLLHVCILSHSPNTTAATTTTTTTTTTATATTTAERSTTHPQHIRERTNTTAQTQQPEHNSPNTIRTQPKHIPNTVHMHHHSPTSHLPSFLPAFLPALIDR